MTSNKVSRPHSCLCRDVCPLEHCPKGHHIHFVDEGLSLHEDGEPHSNCWEVPNIGEGRDES